MNNLKEFQDKWENSAEFQLEVSKQFYDLTNENEVLKAHRDFVETNSFGFGERCFYHLYRLICREMPKRFTFLEIGVYRGATLSLWEMLAKLEGKDVERYAVSPLSSEGGFEDSNYEEDVKRIHKEFNVSENYTIFKGLSTDHKIIEQVEDVQLDVLFIDGGHDFKTVTSDLINYTPQLKVGGYLIMDDCSNDLLLPSGYFGGIQSVTDANKSFMDLYGGYFEFVGALVHNKVYRKILKETN